MSDEFQAQLGEAYRPLLEDPLSAVTRSRQRGLVVVSAVLLLMAVGVVSVTGASGTVSFTVSDQNRALVGGMTVCAYFVLLYLVSALHDYMAYRWTTAKAGAALFELVYREIGEPTAENEAKAEEIKTEFYTLGGDLTKKAANRRAELTAALEQLTSELPSAKAEVAERGLRQLKLIRRLRLGFEVYLPIVLGIVSIATAIAAL